MSSSNATCDDNLPTHIDPVQDLPTLHPIDAAVAAPAASICPDCGDAGYYAEAVPFGDPHFGVLFPCHCKQREQERRAAEEMERLSNLQAFRDKTFKRFNAFAPGVQIAYRRAVAYARRPKGWLVLFGGYGCGKTHMAAAVANTLLNRGCQVLFIVVPDLLDHLRATFGPDSQVTYDERFDLVRAVPLLVLDDLGAENPTPWVREKLYQLVNHRYNERLPTVFTSNTKLDQIDPRIYSRMCDPDLCAEITVITAGDYRRRNQTP